MTANSRDKNYSHTIGELRPTQIMFSFGVGALIDLPHLSAVVTGLDDWPADPGIAPEIVEDRLLATVRQQLGEQVKALKRPPAPPPTNTLPNPFDADQRIGVPVATFPRWLLCPSCQLLAPIRANLFTLKTNEYHPERARYVHEGCDRAKNPAAVPARFLVACPNGHVDDFPWIEFVHRGPTNCRAVLRLIEFGPSGEARDVMARCDTCGDSRRLSDAFGNRGKAFMPMCRGRRPHLRDFEDEPCTFQSRTILLGASNLWFPDVLTALSVPIAAASPLEGLVDDVWALLKNTESAQNIGLLRDVMPNLASLTGYTNEEIWSIVEQRQKGQGAAQADDTPVDLKTPEWTVFSNPSAVPQSEDFRLRAVAVPRGFEALIERVVLVEQLREVRALIGFTRIDAPGELGDEQQDTRRMRVSRRAPDWIPAAEVRGEGIFIQLNEAAIQGWLRDPAVLMRSRAFHESHIAWRSARHIAPAGENDPGMRFVLLNTLAHALMRQFTLACGYTAASIRERLYARNPNESDHFPEPMAGLLIYTAAPDSEGTLGGLVNLGQPEALHMHLTAALTDARLCASDPLCAENPPSTQGMTLHAAACHACMFAPETSCECGNRYLDRSVLMPTLHNEDLAFFRDVVWFWERFCPISNC
ncbi:DUF1998 domain-containing protein [Chloroflexi bacterium TSY]|nr:DUF1998 domain-containing protein [Chloroflexi bacterium TSY]